MPGSPSAERARRLLALLPHLSRPGRRSLRDLAALSNTDEATLAADLTALSLCGAGDPDPEDLVAVYVEDGSAVVFGELPALGRPVRLTPAESRALSTALEACGLPPGSELARRLAGIAGDGETEAASAPADGAGLSDSVRMHVLLAACASAHRAALVTYTRLGTATAEERTVHPWRLFFSRGTWYLRAWAVADEEHPIGGERTLRLDRIGSVTPTSGTFEPPVDLPDEIDAAPDPDVLPRAEIVFSRDTLDLDERSWPGSTFVRSEDGTVVAHVPYAGTRWIARKVAAKLGSAVVTAPADVREAVRSVAADESARAAAVDG